MNPNTKRRLALVGALLIGGAGLSAVMMGSMEESLVYFWDARQVIEAGEDAVGATIRLGGLVEAGSVNWNSDGQELAFRVTESTGEFTVPAYAKGAPPQMFREGIGVVVEGTMDASGTFQCDQVMVKHSNEYKAPEEGVDPKDLYNTLEEEF